MNQLSQCNLITSETTTPDLKQITTPELRDESNQTSSKHKLSLKKQTTKAHGREKFGIEDDTGHNPLATLHQHKIATWKKCDADLKVCKPTSLL